MKQKMEKIINRDIYKAVFINLIIAFFCIIFCDAVFETNDDYGMATIAYGYLSGYSNSHLIFSNIFLGKGLQILINIFSGIPWYGVCQFTSVFVSFLIITYILIKKEDKWCGYFLSSIILFFCAYEFYVKLQFTKTAGITSIAGVLLIFYTIQQHIHYKRNIIVGIFMIVIGSWYRFEACMLALLILSTLGIIEIVNNIKKYKIKEKLDIKEYILIFGIVLILIISFKILDIKFYENNQDWSKYVEYNQKRANLLDYGFPDYNEFQQEYEELGISKNDLDLFSSWIFADPEVFNVELMDSLIKLRPSKKIDLDFFIDFFKIYPYSFLNEKLFLISIIFALFWILDKKGDKYILPYIVVVIFLYDLIFFYKGRYLMHRVDVVLWTAVLCLFAYLVKDLYLIEKLEYKKYIIILFLILSVFNLEPYLSSMKTKNNTTEWMNSQKEMCEMIGNNKEGLYFTLAVDNRFVCYRPYNSMQKGLFSNVYPLGGWGIQMPLTNLILENYNVYNPFREIVNNPAIYLVTEGMQPYRERIVTYIQEHYDKEAYAVLVKSYEGYNFYKIISGSVNKNIPNEAQFDDSIVSDYEMKIENDIVNLKGHVYKKDTNSFVDELLLRITYTNPDKQVLFYIPQYINSDAKDMNNGKYSEFDYSIQLTDYEDVELELILDTDHKSYIDRIKE